MSDQSLWAQSPLAVSQAMMRYQSSRLNVLSTLERQSAEKKPKPNSPKSDDAVSITISAAAQAKMAEAPS
jgi:hypothetical protein